MDERQVNIVRAQLLQTFLQAGDEFVFAQVLDPDFGSDEQLITRHAAFGDSLTHRGFVVIDLRSVDSTIARSSAVFTDAITTSSFRRKVPRPNAGIAMIFLIISSFRLTDEIMADGVEGKKSD